MKYNEVSPSFINPIGNTVQQIDYTPLEGKWSHDFNLNSRYKTGQQYKLVDDEPYGIIELVVDGIFDEIRKEVVEPNDKIVIENHRFIIMQLLKNMRDSKIQVDLKNILCIIDGIIYANGRQYYRKDGRSNG